MESRIRHAEEKDIPKIMDLLVQVCNVHAKGRPDLFYADRTKYTETQLALLLKDETRPIYVAVDEDDQVLAYSFCFIESTEGSNNRPPIKSIYIDDLCVDENTRSNGIGQALFDYIRQYAETLGCHSVTLNVWAFNTPAIRFYEKQGMTAQRTIMEVLL